jgi:hypothetical protein
MKRGIHQLVEAIDAITSVESADDLSRLQDLADRYFTSRQAAKHLEVWFRLYERFPEDDGCGIFWAILHGLEALPDCDTQVVASVRRKPSQFPVRMVNRMLNADIRTVAGVDLLDLLKTVAADKSCPVSVRQDARGYLKHQRGRD